MGCTIFHTKHFLGGACVVPVLVTTGRPRITIGPGFRAITPVHHYVNKLDGLKIQLQLDLERRLKLMARHVY